MRSQRLDSLLSLEGKVAVVTGAAGQLGRAFCSLLRDAGAVTVGADVREEENVYETDVTDDSLVTAFFERISAEHGRLDILVNNAGIGVYSPLEERTPADLSAVAAVNLAGTALCTRAASRLMGAGGSVVNIASIYGIVSPDPRIYGTSGRNSSEIYGATKAGVIQMTKWFAVHLAPRNIRVNAISPGGVFAAQSSDFVAAYELRTPLGRMASVDDLLGGLLYLASDASAYVTGHNLVIDGGWSVW